MNDMVSVDTGDGFMVDTNTATAAEVRETHAPPADNSATPGEISTTPGDISAPERDEKGRFTKPATETPAADVSPVPPPSSSTDPPAETDEPVKRERKLRERIGTITWELREAERQLAARRAELEASGVERVASLPQKAAIEPASGTRTKPTEEQIGTTYATYADFVEDLADWKAEQRWAAKDAERQQAEAAKSAEDLRRKLDASMTQARQQYPDWDDTIAAANRRLAEAGIYQLPPALDQAIQTSEKTIDLLRFLGTHPEDAIQLVRDSAALPASAAPWVRHVLESRLPAAPSGSAVPTVSRTSAAPPIKPVGASLSARDSGELTDDLSDDEYLRRASVKSRS